MSALQLVAIVIGVGLTIIGWGMLLRVSRHFYKVFTLGQPEHGQRTNAPAQRTATLLREFLGHGRMARLPVVAVAHWLTMVGFGVLFFTLVQATVQLFKPDAVLPLIGHFPPYAWVTEFLAWSGFIGIIVLVVIRQRSRPKDDDEGGRRSRFYGSTFWQAYYVEFTIFGVGTCILLLRSLEYALETNRGGEHAGLLNFPLTSGTGQLFTGMSDGALETAIILVALVKIMISYAWMITVSLNPTMGVAWHRFLAFPNIWFKRNADGATALGPLKPMTVDGEPFSMETMEEMDEETTLGVGKVEDFTWKGLLDFSTCTECGRCQSQCPAWNTEKPLSPKMLMITLRDHAHAKAPYLAAARGTSGVMDAHVTSRPQTGAGPVPPGGGVGLLAGEGGADGEDRVGSGSPQATATAVVDKDGESAIDWGSMALVGQTGYDIDNPLTAYQPFGPDAVIDEDVLWSCTTCGACVEQCPVDIEHVDHIVDMRRYQNLIESAFPSELGGLFKKMESKGNPWGMGAKARMDWAKDLPFTIKVLGEDVESADEVDYLFWVGCAGAYEDRAKKTTRAIAELFDHAGVNFAVLGNGETCTGDSARRAGNEVLFQMLAEQNVATLNEVGATRIVVTCAHCFNTIKNEYPQLGGHYEVLHHTQLLNRLVRDKKIVPVNRPSGSRRSSLKDVASSAETVTYHDPCYLGRHNNVYSPPRELIGSLPGVELREMERSGEKSFCCGAGGARMWMEEQLGSRININRTEEAIGTGAERIAIGCPFCRVMLSDGLTAKQSEGASEEIEVVDIAQMLLASIKEPTGKQGTTEAEDQAAAGPTTAVPAPAESAGDPEAASATPDAPSAEESAQTAKAIEEAGGDASAVDATPAAKNAAPSWESDSTPAAKNAAPSWESDATPAAKNAAPSWETPASATAEAKGEDVAAKNAAPSWESDATPAAKNAAPSWETASAPAATSKPAEVEPQEHGTDAPAPAPAATAEPDSVAAKNAAPSWETASTPAATSKPAEVEPVTAEVEPQEQGTDAPAPAPTAAAEPDSLAAKNAAPSWETASTPAAATLKTPEVEPEEATPTAEATPTEAEVQPEEQGTDAPAPAPTATAEPDSLAAKNAAPSWETASTPAATSAPAQVEPETAEVEPETAEVVQETAEVEPQEQGAEAPTPQAAAEPEGTPATDAPQATSSQASGVDLEDLKAKNAKPSWE